MRDRPNGAELLAVGRRSLLAPALQGQPRYVTLMVANAMGIALRELEEAERFERAQSVALAHVSPNNAAELVKSLRAGQHDADPSLHGALKDYVEIAATIWKPGPVAKDG